MQMFNSHECTLVYAQVAIAMFKLVIYTSGHLKLGASAESDVAPSYEPTV